MFLIIVEYVIVNLKFSDYLLFIKFQVLHKHLRSILAFDSRKIPCNPGRLSIAEVISASQVLRQLTSNEYDKVRPGVELGSILINYRGW